jgi:hypothetical protein
MEKPLEKSFITILEEKGKMGSRVVYALIFLPYIALFDLLFTVIRF